MALFNRNSKETNQPTSLEQYYATQRRSSVASWVLTAGVFIGSVLVVLGLVFGGRYAYRQIVDNNDEQSPTVSQQENQTSTNQDQSTVTDKRDESGSNPGASTTPATPAPSQPSTPPPATSNPTPAPAPQPQPTASRPAPATPAPVTGGTASPAQLPNSGPESLVGIFVVASFLTATAHYIFNRFRLRSKNS